MKRCRNCGKAISDYPAILLFGEWAHVLSGMFRCDGGVARGGYDAINRDERAEPETKQDLIRKFKADYAKVYELREPNRTKYTPFLVAPIYRQAPL